MNFNSDNVKEERAKNIESNQEQIVSDEEIFEQAKINAKDIISIPNLIKGIITFAETLGDMNFYPYQEEVVERIVYDLVTDGGNTIAVLFARQTGKSFSMSCLVPSLCILLPLVAQTMEARGIENHNLLKFRKGLWVGVYGPDYERAGIIGNKINTVLGSKNSKLILSHPDIGMTFPERLNRYIGHLPRGSRINVKSANKRVSIEGDTYHLVITDETQAISDYVLKKSISPFLSSTNGTKVHLGSAYPLKVYFYDVLSLNKREDINRPKKLKCHFDISYQVAEKYNKNYKKYVEKEKKLLGVHSDEFRMCVAPETRILTADLRHILASEVVEGMRLVGFDENSLRKGRPRNFRETIVEKVWNVIRPSYKLELEDGTVIICSAEHPWLVTTSGRRTVWKATEDIGVKRYANQKAEDRIFKITGVWDYAETYQVGYLAGVYDGEGSISSSHLGHLLMSFSQKEGAVLEQVRKYLIGANFSLSERTQPNNCKNLYVKGGKAEIIRFLGQIRPMRLLNKFKVEWLGSIGRHDHRCDGKGFDHPRIIKKTFIGNRKLVAFRTSTRTFVAEGLASHNSYENYWPIDKGMLITEDFLVNKLGKDYPTSTYNKKDEHVIGIDVGKIQDPTVITVLKPDWENPITVDSDSKTVRYLKPISNWYEIFGDDYDSQYYQICDFLDNYKWSICVIDATGVGQGMYDRLNNKYSKQGKRVIPFVFTRPDKSLLYSLLSRELLAERVIYPNNSAAQRQRKQQKFVSQLLDMSKKIEGGYLTFIPTSDTGHDDYVASAALAVWGVEGDNIAIDIEEVSVGESFYKKSKTERNFWKN